MSDSKKRQKSYYVQGRKSKKQASGYQLDAGMKGFLITCNNAEKKTVQEAYNILSEYAEQMYGCEKVDDLDDASDQDNNDFESAMQKEFEALQKSNVAERRFQVVETKTNNSIFIRTPIEHPDELVTEIFRDLSENKKSKSRFILKMFPVLGTCKAAEDKIEKLTEEVVAPFLKGTAGLTFCVIYKARCNNTLGREAVIHLVARVVAEINPLVKVKFDNPDLVISVDVLQKVCCLSVMKNFHKFRKYNIQEVITANRLAGVPQSSEVHEEANSSSCAEQLEAAASGEVFESGDHGERVEDSSNKCLESDEKIFSDSNIVSATSNNNIS